jgi:hypothetical protein
VLQAVSIDINLRIIVIDTQNISYDIIAQLHLDGLTLHFIWGVLPQAEHADADCSFHSSLVAFYYSSRRSFAAYGCYHVLHDTDQVRQRCTAQFDVMVPSMIGVP